MQETRFQLVGGGHGTGGPDTELGSGFPGPPAYYILLLKQHEHKGQF